MKGKQLSWKESKLREDDSSEEKGTSSAEDYDDISFDWKSRIAEKKRKIEESENVESRKKSKLSDLAEMVEEAGETSKKSKLSDETEEMKRKKKKRKKRKKSTPSSSESENADESKKKKKLSTAVTANFDSKNVEETGKSKKKKKLSTAVTADFDSENIEETGKGKKNKRKKKKKSAVVALEFESENVKETGKKNKREKKRKSTLSTIVAAELVSETVEEMGKKKKTRKRKSKKKKKSKVGDESEPSEEDLEKMLYVYMIANDAKEFRMNSNAEFELMSDWPWTARARKNEADYASQPRKLKIHGLFRGLNQSVALDKKQKSPKATQNQIRAVEAAVNGMEPNGRLLMNHYWPPLVRYVKPEELWTHEFLKHGRPSGMSRPQYFSLGLRYYYILTHDLKFKTNKRYKIHEFLGKMRRHAKRNMGTTFSPNLFCVNSRSIPCMSNEAKVQIFRGLSTCIKRTAVEELVFAEKKDFQRWMNRKASQSEMIIPYKEVGHGEGSEEETV